MINSYKLRQKIPFRNPSVWILRVCVRINVCMCIYINNNAGLFKFGFRYEPKKATCVDVPCIVFESVVTIQ